MILLHRKRNVSLVIADCLVISIVEIKPEGVMLDIRVSEHASIEHYRIALAKMYMGEKRYYDDIHTIPDPKLVSLTYLRSLDLSDYVSIMVIKLKGDFVRCAEVPPPECSVHRKEVWAALRLDV